jgi:rhamnogalacturonyl hydrolase YesR
MNITQFFLTALFVIPHVSALSGNPGHYTTLSSILMSKSIISRGQGLLTGQGDSSALLQAGLVQKSFRQVIVQYPENPSIQAYISKSVDSVVSTISNATADTKFPLDRLSSGNGLIHAWQETGEEKYKTALEALRESVDLQPRNNESGLWYYVYPNWSYLDGMYSFSPFLTLYTTLYGSGNANGWQDVERQFDLLWQHCYRNETGLLAHGYDASKTAVWADLITGASPHVWGRSLGWYAMALVDTLELLRNLEEPQAKHLEHYVKKRFEDLATAIVGARDEATGAWWQVLDQPSRRENYIESSGSSMLIYSLLKGVRLGYLPRHHKSQGHGSPGNKATYTETALRAYDYVKGTFVVDNGNGTVGWNGTVGVCSLNSTASYEVGSC